MTGSDPPPRRVAAGGAASRNGVLASGLVTVAVGRFEDLVALGLAAVLQADRGVDVLASDLDGDALESLVARRAPQVVIVDEAVEHALLSRLRLRRGAAEVLVLATNPANHYGTLLLDAGVSCLPRKAGAQDILAAVHRAARGEPTFLCASGERLEPPAEVDLSELTARELQVLRLICEGKHYSEIAHILHIATETVRGHTRAICRKLNRSRLELVSMRLPRLARQEILT